MNSWWCVDSEVTIMPVLGLAGRLVGKLQVRGFCVQNPYHKQWIRVFVGTWPIHAPGARWWFMLSPFVAGFLTHSKPLGHGFMNKIRPHCCALFPKVLCSDMERGAQVSVMMCCLLQHKTKEVLRLSAQVPLKKADKSKPLHQSFWLFSRQPTADKKGGNGMVLFLSVLGCSC